MQRSKKKLAAIVLTLLLLSLPAANAVSESIVPDMIFIDYTPFGLEEGEAYDTFEGKAVREIYNPVTGTLTTRSHGPVFPADAVDLIAVYENGVLAGLKEASPEAIAKGTRLREKYKAESQARFETYFIHRPDMLESMYASNIGNMTLLEYQLKYAKGELPEFEWADAFPFDRFAQKSSEFYIYFDYNGGTMEYILLMDSSSPTLLTVFEFERIFYEFITQVQTIIESSADTATLDDIRARIMEARESFITVYRRKAIWFTEPMLFVA